MFELIRSSHNSIEGSNVVIDTAGESVYMMLSTSPRHRVRLEIRLGLPIWDGAPKSVLAARAARADNLFYEARPY